MTMTEADDTYFAERAALNPVGLKPGTLVYLWRPGETPWAADSRPALVRVETARAHAIVGVDLADTVRAIYDVTNDLPGHRWSWEVAAGPRQACTRPAAVDAEELTFEERQALLLGSDGQLITVHLNGGSSVSGVVDKVVYREDKPWALVLVSPPDQRGGFVASVLIHQIAQIMRVGDA